MRLVQRWRGARGCTSQLKTPGAVSGDYVNLQENIEGTERDVEMDFAAAVAGETE